MPRCCRSKWLRLLALVVVLVLLGGIFTYFSIKAEYPRAYFNLVNACAKEFGLDAYLVLAVIKTESNFQPEALSSKGAVGLMQLLPATAEWIAKKKNLPYTEGCLTQPESNLRLGCAYLSYLAGLYPERGTQLAAYNAGPARVRQWLAETRYSADGIVLQNIPYPETKNYVEKVLQAYGVYNWFYA